MEEKIFSALFFLSRVLGLSMLVSQRRELTEKVFKD